MNADAQDTLDDRRQADGAAAVGMVGPYRLGERLGRGGAGAVYRAVHARTGRTVALKLIAIADDAPARDLELVAHEAMAMAALRHPRIVTCHSFGEDGRQLYLALELVTGGDTARLVARNPGGLDEATIRRLAEQCAEGLAAIHAAGLVHRDIKPSNVLLDAAGAAKLGDFGLACPRDTPHGSAGGAGGAGTPAYMPPETMARDQRPDERGDVYSLGATMYCWAAGAPPFQGENAYATMHRVLAGPPPDLASRRPDLSADLVRIIATAMARDPVQRFPNAGALLRALRGEPPAAAIPLASAAAPAPQAAAVAPAGRAAAGTDTGPAWRRRTWTPWIAAAAAVALIALLLPSGERPAAAAPAALAADGTPAAAVGGPDGWTVAWLGDPLLRFAEIGAVRYARSGARLHLDGESWLDGAPAPELTGLLAANGDFAVELVIDPGDLVQEGPARILTIGPTARTTSLMIGQSGSRLEVRVRTSATNPDGTRPHLVSGDGVLSGERQHVIFTRAAGSHRLYVDGAAIADAEVPGDLSVWDAQHPLAIGNDPRGGFPWAGSIDRLVLRAGAWTAEEVAARHRAWAQAAAGPLPAARQDR